MATSEITDLTVNVDFECHEDGKIDKPKITYRAKVEFDSLARVLEYGGESVTRVLQTWARKNKFPKGERVTVRVGEKVEFAKPVTQEEVARWSDEELELAFLELQARRQAKAATEMAAVAKDGPKTQKVKGPK